MDRPIEGSPLNPPRSGEGNGKSGEWTPGPWESRHPEDSSAHVVRIFVDGKGRRCTSFVCSCDSATLANDDNARLIAAAPCLYAALELVAGVMRESAGIVGFHLNGNLMPWGELDPEGKIAAALAKARGEQ